MRITNTDIDGAKIFDPERHFDERGWSSELWNSSVLGADEFGVSFVQDTLASSSQSGTVRGMHFQFPPHDQGKLIICLSGAIFDVALDIRVGSPSFGQHVALTLSGDDSRQCWIPSGFAHGYCGLESENLILYGFTKYRSKKNEVGILWNDDVIKIKWPIKKPILSKKDKNNITLKKFNNFYL